MIKFLMLVLGLIALTPSVNAASTADTNRLKDVLDQNPPGSQVRLGTELTRKKRHVVRGNYSWAVQGGSTTADITLLDDEGKSIVIPDDAIITNVLVDVQTALTSDGSATVALTAQSAGDLKAAAAVSSGYTTGIKAGVPVNTAASAIKLTADRTLVMTVAVMWLSAGKMSVLVEYLLSE
jgi:hypothetical protein